MQESISLHFLPLIHILDANPQVHSTVNCTVAECHWFVPSFEHVRNLYLDNGQPQSHLFLDGTVETASFNAFVMLMQINAGWWGAVARCFWQTCQVQDDWKVSGKKHIHDCDCCVKQNLFIFLKKMHHFSLNICRRAHNAPLYRNRNISSCIPVIEPGCSQHNNSLVPICDISSNEVSAVQTPQPRTWGCQTIF